MVSSFLLFPMANALCLVPWVLRETERLARERGGRVRGGSGAVVGLQALGGHPETVVHTALLAALYLAVRGGSGRATWARLVAAFGAGALVAGVHLLPLYFNLTASTRWIEWSAGERLPIAAALDAALRLVLPDLFGNPADGHLVGAVQLQRDGGVRRRAGVAAGVDGVARSNRAIDASRRWRWSPSPPRSRRITSFRCAS